VNLDIRAFHGFVANLPANIVDPGFPRLTHETGSFRSTTEIVFGLGAEERALDTDNAPDFVRLINSVGEVRHPEGPRDHPLWRLHSERWLESLVVKNIAAVDERLTQNYLYSQVPAFSAADRANGAVSTMRLMLRAPIP